MRVSKFLACAVFSLLTMAHALAAGIGNVVTFPDVATVTALGGPGYPRIIIASVTYGGNAGSANYVWQDSSCGVIDGIVWIRPTNTTGCYHMTGAMPASTLSAVAFSGSKNDIGLGNVDNTSDANKPISIATQSALNALQAQIFLGTAPSTPLTASQTLTANDFEIPCNTASAGFRLTIPLNLGTATKPKWFFVFKTSTDEANAVTLSTDGATDIQFLTNPVFTSTGEYRGGGLWVRVDGTRLSTFGVP